MSRIIKPKDNLQRILRSFRLKKELDQKIDEICKDTGEKKTHVVESLLEFAIDAYEGEKNNSK